MRSNNVASHVLGCGKVHRHTGRTACRKRRCTDKIAADVAYAFARATRSSNQGRQRIFVVACTRGVLLPLVQSVRVVGIRRRAGPPRLLSNAEQPHFPSRRNTNRIREQIGRLGIAGTSFGAGEWLKESRAHHHAYLARNVREMGGTSMGAFETLVDLLDKQPQLPGEAPLTIRGTSSG